VLGITLVLCTGQPGQAQRRARGSGGKKAPPAAETPREPHVEGAADASGLEGAQDAAQGAAPTSAATPPGTGAAHGLPSEGGAPSAKPAAEASPANVPEEPAPEGAAPAALSKDVAGVMDELVQLRARTRVLGKALFKTKVRIRVENEAAPDQIAARLQLWLDGAPVWSGDGSGLRDAERVLFEGLAAPGPHVLTYEVEQRARDDEKYRYTQRASLRFVALRDRRMDLVLVLEDDSDMAEDFPDDADGEYDLRVKLRARVEE
jgi:hypothetical protein